MTITTDHTVITEHHLREAELVVRLEERRKAAELAREEHGGRLAAAAAFARSARRGGHATWSHWAHA